MTDPQEPNEVPEAVLARLRAIATALPEVHEEPAWVGTRWSVRRKTFAHLFAVDEHSPPVLARIAEALGRVTVLVFRSEGPELDALRSSGPPFYNAGWGRDAIAIALGDATDWAEVEELVTESYCVQAPQKLQALVARPGG